MSAMNMDEWQRKMREEKKREREQKNQSAALLNKYRGDVSEDDLKLAALKQEERQKQLAAERLLHDFRNDDMGDIRQKRPNEPTDENAAASPDARATRAGEAVPVTPGQSVASLKDKFASPAAAEAAAAGSADAGDLTSPPPPDAGAVAHEFSNLGVVAETADQFQSPAAKGATTATDAAAAVAPTMIASSLGAGAVSETSSATAAPATAAAATTESSGAAAAAEVAAAASTPTKGDAAPAPAMMSTPSAAETTTAAAAASTNGNTEPPPEAVVVRLDVLVSFGLLTSAENPELGGYLQAAEKVVQGKLALAKQSNQQWAQAEYDPDFQPYVKSRKLDAEYSDSSGRTDVQRQLIVVGVPMFMNDEQSIGTVRDGVVQALQSAIQSGEFVELALGGMNAS